MFDFGIGVSFIFVDYNVDGFLDLVVGMVGVFEFFGEWDICFYFFENIGIV